MFSSRFLVLIPLLMLAGTTGLLLWHQQTLTGTILGFPSDDAWIHMTFGRNLAFGYGFGLNPGEPAAGSTSVPWSLTIALAHLLTAGGGLPLVIGSIKALGFLLAVLTLFGANRIFNLFWASFSWSLFGTITVLLAYPLNWAALSGMEVPLTACLCIWALYFQLRGETATGTPRHHVLAGALWGASACTRPENMLFVVFMPIVQAASFRARGRRSPVGLPAAAVAVLIGFLGLQYLLTGSVLPNTFPAKMTDRALPLLWQTGDWSRLGTMLWSSPLQYGQEVIGFIGGENLGILLLLGLFPLVFLRRSTSDLAPEGRLTLLAAWLGLPVFTLAVGWIAGPEHFTHAHGRYLAHTLVLAVIPATLFAGGIVKAMARPALGLALFTGLLLTLGVERQLDLAPRFAQETQNINDLQIRWARWWRSAFPRPVKVGLNDIGAMGYFSGQTLIDLEGLCLPAAVPFRRAGRIVDFIENVQPDFLLVFPYWYPAVVARPEAFRPLARVIIDRNVTGGGEELVLFATPWGSSPSALPPVAPTVFPEHIPDPLGQE